MSGKVRIGAAIALALAMAAPTAEAADRLPDLGMARITDLKTGSLSNGNRILRFSATIVNTGVGPFDVRAARGSSSDPFPAPVQRIYDTAGGFREVPTTGTLVYGGDGHNHWHLRELERMELIRLDNGVKVGTGAKRGFCFYDNVAYRTWLTGAPANPFYVGCGSLASTTVTMGLSIGWGDEYRWSLPDQWIDITGLAAGRYRLLVTADAIDQFVESDVSNNATWVDLQLKPQGNPRILGYGPAA